MSDATQSIRVVYFALLREERGLSEETLQTVAKTPQALYEQLRADHGFRLGHEQLKVAVNDTFVTWDHVLSDGDEVVFIPPVAGG